MIGEPRWTRQKLSESLKKLVKGEWELNTPVPLVLFPQTDEEVPDKPKLTLVVVDPEESLDDELRIQLSSWTKVREDSRRLYPASIIWAVRRQGRELFERVENYLAWKRVFDEISSGLLGDFEQAERRSAKEEVGNAEDDARDEIWASYQYALFYDGSEKDGLKLIALGAGHASAGDSLASRVLEAMKSEGLLNESVGVHYLQRNWPTALKESGIWPLSGLRQSFLDGSLTRLIRSGASARRADHTLCPKW